MSTVNSNTALNAYRNTGIESIVNTAAPHQLVLLLFNGARAAVAEARGHMNRKEINAKGNAISKAISIIDGGLKASLDLKVGGELALNLSELYVYMTRRLFEANLKNDAVALDEVAQLLEQLGGAWEMIAAKAVDSVAARQAPAKQSAREPQAARPYAAAPAADPVPATRDAGASPSLSARVAAAYGVR